ncbi:hypothetical protein, partial [Streptosporangium sp. NPDC048865]|uniref:hypothetical protein n=1 Tax=Streptosporangium sp. NPDC048865 TaxID=3155766 RepID=UPI003447198A
MADLRRSTPDRPVTSLVDEGWESAIQLFSHFYAQRKVWVKHSVRPGVAGTPPGRATGTPFPQVG